MTRLLMRALKSNFKKLSPKSKGTEPTLRTILCMGKAIQANDCIMKQSFMYKEKRQPQRSQFCTKTPSRNGSKYLIQLLTGYTKVESVT
ncbi:13474_t:CDS:2 [Funneliformis mosseae]|uniref:13474_t:CDS:1 n=1 Tax=Funneliformis mosseae TaxID=27381 RepID=A0A9N9CFC4_FUNMO|nr:13474_t:CDS:2 [Funneliformis mosseae]